MGSWPLHLGLVNTYQWAWENSNFNQISSQLYHPTDKPLNFKKNSSDIRYTSLAFALDIAIKYQALSNTFRCFNLNTRHTFHYIISSQCLLSYIAILSAKLCASHNNAHDLIPFKTKMVEGNYYYYYCCLREKDTKWRELSLLLSFLRKMTIWQTY